jgi:hypothetical protein
LWLKVFGPQSVFHVAAMIAPWLKGFAWSKPTPGFPRLQDMQSSVSVCFQLKSSIDPFVGQGRFSTGRNFWLDGDQAAYTELVWRVATQCHFAMHTTRTCQCDSGPTEPCILATSMLEHIPAGPCPCHDVAMFEMLFGASKRNWDKPSSASPLLQDMQLPTFFRDRHTALFGCTATDRKLAMERISLRQKNVLIRPYSLAASVLWFIPAFCPRHQRSQDCDWKYLVHKVSSMLLPW